jgi:hypothetical protein
MAAACGEWEQATVSTEAEAPVDAIGTEATVVSHPSSRLCARFFSFGTLSCKDDLCGKRISEWPVRP